MNLNMTISKIKAIDALNLSLPLDKGLYAITGENGSGKSTVITCASSSFYNMKMVDYFGKTENDSKIYFEFDNGEKIYAKDSSGRWYSKINGKFRIKGFYEGSVIYGNRFRTTNYNNLKKLEYINNDVLSKADDYILHNLGYILHNNKNYYEKIYKASSNELAKKHIFINGDLFFYEKNGKLISQFHMSTGENLLISILNSLLLRNTERTDFSEPCLILLDEIELALHPSSLKRLVSFLKEESDKYNYAIYFSTHSIEIIGAIKPDNIYFLNRHIDNSLEVINPCYPAYATRILYDQTGYDYIILVEDDLARSIVNQILRKYSLLGNRLVHVLPAGGYQNVIDLGNEVVNSNLVGKIAKIIIILDGDVKEETNKYISRNQIRNNIPIDFLPIESLEKYFKKNLVDSVNKELFHFLNDYIFQQKSLSEITQEYQNSGDYQNDPNGKKFYKRIDNELRQRNKTRIEIIELVVDFLMKENDKNIQTIVEFLQNKMKNS